MYVCMPVCVSIGRQLEQRVVCVVSYRDVFVLDEQAVEEPDNGAEGEREGEGEGHVLHTLGLDDSSLGKGTHQVS